MTFITNVNGAVSVETWGLAIAVTPVCMLTRKVLVTRHGRRRNRRITSATADATVSRSRNVTSRRCLLYTSDAADE